MRNSRCGYCIVQRRDNMHRTIDWLWAESIFKQHRICCLELRQHHPTQANSLKPPTMNNRPCTHFKAWRGLAYHQEEKSAGPRVWAGRNAGVVPCRASYHNSGRNWIPRDLKWRVALHQQLAGGLQYLLHMTVKSAVRALQHSLPVCLGWLPAWTQKGLFGL